MLHAGQTSWGGALGVKGCWAVHPDWGANGTAGVSFLGPRVARSTAQTLTLTLTLGSPRVVTALAWLLQ